MHDVSCPYERESGRDGRKGMRDEREFDSVAGSNGDPGNAKLPGWRLAQCHSGEWRSRLETMNVAEPSGQDSSTDTKALRLT